MADPKIDNLCVTTMRMLAVDMVQTAKSGHPGMPLGASPAAYVIWDRILKHNPKNPLWADRDRFVLSAGHACAMLYSLLHLTGYDLPLEDLKRFRQVDSKCPGHPEVHITPGVEATAGPLGQGISNAVGMAIAERHMAAIFNKPGHDVVDHHTFVMCSDGDLMEGVASEACSLAGFLKLGKLVVLYDDNGISIEGKTHELAFKENIRGRFEAYGWHVLEVENIADLNAVEKALRAGIAEDSKPTLIWGHSMIGYGSPIAGTSKVHGEPMNDGHASETRKYYEWDKYPAFSIPEDALAHFRKAVNRGAEAETDWNRKFSAYSKSHPELAKRFQMMMKGELPEGWEKSVPVFAPGKDVATRSSGGDVMNAIAKSFEGYLVGGSADLSPSTKTIMNGFGDIKPGDFGGMNMHFGVREHAMGSVMNGMALHRGIIPFGATFMVFSDYMRPPIRIAAISSLQAIYVFTHDSIGVGEDGPTHQPVEHVAALRAIPNTMVLRPADANETAEAWKVALKRREGPTVLALTRQNLPILDVAKYPIQQGVQRGGYVISEAEGGKPDVILIATGSEVSLALQAQAELGKENIRARVVSMPSMELFEAQDAAYRDSVLPPEIGARLAIEAGVRLGWDRHIGPKGDGIWQEVFGVSGQYKHIFKKVGFTVENVVLKAKQVIKKQ